MVETLRLLPVALVHILHAHHGAAFPISPTILAALQVAVALAVVVVAVTRLQEVGRSGRKERTSDPDSSVAVFLLAASLILLAAGSVSAVLPFGFASPAVSDFLALASSTLLVGCVLALPGTPLSARYRWRVIVDGLMILVFASMVAWVFSVGPGLQNNWHSMHAEISALAYPIMDVVLVGALLVVSARFHGLPSRRWWPLPAGIATAILADWVREFAAHTGNATAGQAWRFVLLGSSMLLGLAVVALVPVDGEKIKRSRPQSAPRRDVDGSEVGDSAHIWDSLLPSALVPASAALAIDAVESRNRARDHVWSSAWDRHPRHTGVRETASGDQGKYQTVC